VPSSHSSSDTFSAVDAVHVCGWSSLLSSSWSHAPVETLKLQEKSFKIEMRDKLPSVGRVVLIRISQRVFCFLSTLGYFVYSYLCHVSSANVHFALLRA